jgi:hypothetical protein
VRVPRVLCRCGVFCSRMVLRSNLPAQRLQTEITQLMRQHMDVSQERDDAVAARDAATLELRFVFRIGPDVCAWL